MIKKVNYYFSLLFITGLLLLFITGCKEDEEITQVTDIDGNVYNIITLLDQVWLAEDLRTTKFNDGTPIPNITDNSAWSNLNTPGYCWYNNDIFYKYTNGALYNWHAINTQKLCPTGWHVPTKAEIETLITNFSGTLLAGGKLKETSTTHWLTPNEGASNSTNFTALGGGIREIDGTFQSMFSTGDFWTSTKNNDSFAGVMGLKYDTRDANVYQLNLKTGASVRCIKDN